MDDLDEILETLKQAWSSVAAQVATIWVPIQVVEIVLAALAGWAIAAFLRKRIDLLALTMGWPVYLRAAARAVIANLGIMVSILLLLVIRAAMMAATVPSRSYLIGVAANLATAWVVISVLASIIHNQFVNRLVSVVAWTFAALSILGLIEPVSDALDSAGIAIGGLRITALVALKATALLLLALWAATSASNFLDRQLRSYPDLTPSIQVLLGKLVRVALITFAVLVVLSTVGIDFSALALFSGAVGVGVGFGLQKIVSNLVSGIILLADKSIKPGDIITLGDNWGWVDTMGARYTSVVSPDGREYLIPNEDFVTQRVINWSYSNDRVAARRQVRGELRERSASGARGRAGRRGGTATRAERAGASLPSGQVRRFLARLLAVVLDRRSDQGRRQRPQRCAVRALGRLQAREHRDSLSGARSAPRQGGQFGDGEAGLRPRSTSDWKLCSA